jgi:uncharacterized membrane protein
MTSQPSLQTAHRPTRLWLALFIIGIGWGITGPFSKLAVSTGNHPIGVTFWNTVIGAAVLTAVLLASGRRLPLERRHLVFFLICGLLGTALPNTLSYTAYQHLPIGIISIVISLVPMATLLLALPMGIERPEPRRLIGLGLGVVAVGLIVLPEASLPQPGQAAWVALPLIVALSYAAENIYIATARPAGPGGVDALTMRAVLGRADLADAIDGGLGCLVRHHPPRPARTGGRRHLVPAYRRLFRLYLADRRLAGRLCGHRVGRDPGNAVLRRTPLPLGLGRPGADVRGPDAGEAEAVRVAAALALPRGQLRATTSRH